MPPVLRVVIGFFSGAGLAFGSLFGVLSWVGLEASTAAVLAAIAALVGAIYGAIALGYRVYGTHPLAILGFVLDLSWSWLNTLAGLLVWIPACLLTRGSLQLSDESRRSGSFVFDKNPRDPSGKVFGATTIGTVIGGGWSSHEEVHVWQARLFGPAYLITYGLAFALGALFRLITGKPSEVLLEAYHRICWEDWAYWAGETSGAKVSVAGWVAGFALSTLYVALVLAIPVGILAGAWALWLGGGLGLIAYSLIRSFTPVGAHHA